MHLLTVRRYQREWILCDINLVKGYTAVTIIRLFYNTIVLFDLPPLPPYDVRTKAAMYHERQRLMHCAIHALNNLFQERWAGRETMDRLALEL